MWLWMGKSEFFSGKPHIPQTTPSGCPHGSRVKGISEVSTLILFQDHRPESWIKLSFRQMYFAHYKREEWQRWVKRCESITTERKLNWSTHSAVNKLVACTSCISRPLRLVFARKEGKWEIRQNFSSGKHVKISNVENKSLIVLALPGRFPKERHLHRECVTAQCRCSDPGAFFRTLGS